MRFRGVALLVVSALLGLAVALVSRRTPSCIESTARLTASTPAWSRAIERSAADSAALQAAIGDQRSQIQAQTEALLRVLDRLPPERPQG